MTRDEREVRAESGDQRRERASLKELRERAQDLKDKADLGEADLATIQQLLALLDQASAQDPEVRKAARQLRKDLSRVTQLASLQGPSPPPGASPPPAAKPQGAPGADSSDHKLVCARCNLRLNTWNGPDGEVTYFHASAKDLPSAGKWRADHEPEPVLRPLSSATLLCDFCSAPNPGWLVRLTRNVQWAEHVTPYGSAEIRDDGGWAACATCRELVDNRKVDLLAERSARSMASLSGGRVEPAVKAALKARQADFWRGKPARAVPLTPSAPKLRVHPRDLPALRDETAAGYRKHGRPEMARWLQSADLYLVRAAQVKHASAMAGPLTSHEGLLGYVPPGAGFMCLEESPKAPYLQLGDARLQVRAYAWQVHGDRVEAVCWASTADAVSQGMGAREQEKLTPLFHGGFSETEGQARTLFDREQFAGPPDIFYPMMVLWYRMTEPRYSSSSLDKPSPKDKRKAARKGQSPGSLDVTVIDVRHPRPAMGSSGGHGREAGWTMDYREDVKGHRKMVRWGEGRKYKRLVWVDGYERGPENAPKKGEKPVVKVVK